MEKEKFFQQFTSYIQKMHQDKSISSIDPNDNLYELGLIDSLEMVGVIVFLESLLDNPISIENYQIRNFYTMNGIFDTFFVQKTTSH